MRPPSSNRTQGMTAIKVLIGLLVLTILINIWYITSLHERRQETDGEEKPAHLKGKSYKDIFQRRGELYNKAMLRSPEARLGELMPLLNELKLVPGDILIDAPAGGDYVAEGIFKYLPQSVSSAVKIFSVEPSPIFSQTGSVTGGHGGVAEFVQDSTRVRHVTAPLVDIPLPPGSATKVSSLAGLHHLSISEKLKFFDEAFRLLSPGGLIVVADVGVGTGPAAFLNDVVDRLTLTGHKGMFFRQNELAAMLLRSGFEDVKEEYVELDWVFDTEIELLQFARDLFGLEKAYIDEKSPDTFHVMETLRKEIRRHLNYKVLGEGPTQRALFPWGLRFAVGHKSMFNDFAV